MLHGSVLGLTLFGMIVFSAVARCQNASPHASNDTTALPRNEASDLATQEEDSSSNYLALGDSYTIGELVAIDERWPEQLVARLREKKHSLDNPQIIATTGWTTEELQSAIRDASPATGRRLVTLLIGVNNQYRGQDIAEYRTQFEELLQSAIRFADQRPWRVIVVSIPDYGVTPFIAERPERDPSEIAKELDEYNAVARKLAERHDAHWVDITDDSRTHHASPEMLAEDGLHPSALLYKRWVDLILPVAEKALRKE